MTISVVIPTIPQRSAMLGEAINSVRCQELYPSEICIAVDSQRQGAAATRQRALNMASAQWVAFLDDDDIMLPDHLKALHDHAYLTDADYVFSYFVRSKGGDPLGHFGKPFNPSVPHHTTITILVKRELAQSIGFNNHADANPAWCGEDWRFTLSCVEAGAKIVHLPRETWIWTRHPGNSSGIPGRGNA